MSHLSEPNQALPEQPPSAVVRISAAQRLHGRIDEEFLAADGLVGPDPGVRFNYRLGRFVKSALPKRSWRDHYYYLQAQGYWVLDNWLLADRTDDSRYPELALGASRGMARRQRSDGAWEYPNPAWRGRIATAEGVWGCLGLLETVRRTGDTESDRAVGRWVDYLQDCIGFTDLDGASAVHYFAERGDELVPNNSALTARMYAEIAVSKGGDRASIAQCRQLLEFLRRVQLPNGELPYAVSAGNPYGSARRHFQCFQYNAFQLLDVLRCYVLLGEPVAREVAQRLVPFVASALSTPLGRADGLARYDCNGSKRRVVYHTAVVAAALERAVELEVAPETPYREISARAYDAVLRCQSPDGSFPFSRSDYGLLRDTRSYPRYLTMILHHLLIGKQGSPRCA